MTTTDAATTSAIALRLKLLGLPVPTPVRQSEAGRLMSPILAHQRKPSRRLAHRPCAADQHIQTFLDSYLEGATVTPRLPRSTFVLDQPGLTRALSLSEDATSFTFDYVESYRVLGGVLYNPRNDHHTITSVFHVAENGLPIPDDKIAVPRSIFTHLLAHTIDAPGNLLTLPWASRQEDPTRCFVSLLLRPVVVPEVPGFSTERSMEIRFIVPGGLVSSLDFIEGIFGSGGNPYLPENDFSLAPESWTGHTGCVILTPHLTALTKKELDLPSWEGTTEHQHRDGQCWKDEAELYDGGKAFERMACDERGVIVTAIADNYFGYCKKKVRTQIGCLTDLLGYVEEEYAGSTVTCPRYDPGQEYTDVHIPEGLTLERVIECNPDRFEAREDGSAAVMGDPTVVLVPAGAYYSMRSQAITWTGPDGQKALIPLPVGNTYVAPNGYQVHARHREDDATRWHLVGAAPWSTQTHKLATVSGGDKSETSRSLLDAFTFGEACVDDVDEDFGVIQAILGGSYTDRFMDLANKSNNHHSILSERRSLGSVIKLLTPSSMHTGEYSALLKSIPTHVKELVFTVKRFYRPSWGQDWRGHFSVGVVNGCKSGSLRLDDEATKINILRVGFKDDGVQHLLSLHPDFSPTARIQTEDNITSSIVAPDDLVSAPDSQLSRRFVANCESLLFQQPDGTIVHGYNKQTESDISDPQVDLFISNLQPLTPADVRAMAADTPGLSRFTQPMQDLVARAAALPEAGDPAKETYQVSAADPRLVNGAPTKNPHYLQVHPNIANPKDVALTDLTNHLFQDVPLDEALRHNVDIVAAGRRNNPPEDGAPPLYAYNPLHYVELPELFMEFISSMTGKSPSTTGASSEGALAKAPFNALPAIYDLSTALLPYALNGYDGWLSSTGYIGPEVQVAHDISLLVPEIFSCMSAEERGTHRLVEDGYLEYIEDFEYGGHTVRTSRLGYRMDQAFTSTFFDRIFLHPDVVFTERMLRPELQDEAVFTDSVGIIVTAHKVVVERYRADGSVERVVPPLRALLEIVIDDASREGWDLTNPEFRALSERENILSSSWCAEHLDTRVARGTRQAHRAIEDLTRFYTAESNEEVVGRLGIEGHLAEARTWLDKVSSPACREHLVDTLGLQPSLA